MKIIQPTYEYHCDEFEQLVKDNKIQFHPKTVEWNKPNELGKAILDQLTSEGVDYQIGDVVIQGTKGYSYIYKILNDPLIGYLDIYHNETFMWCNHTHIDGIHPDIALCHFMSRINPSLNISSVIDEKRGSAILVNDQLICIDSRTSEDRRKMGEK